MITGSLKNQVDRIWDTFWAGGIANPITVVEQFTYLLFLKHLDKQQDEIEKWRLLGQDREDIFPAEATEAGVPLRWRDLLALKDKKRVEAFENHVFPFLTAQEDYPYKSPFGNFLKRAQFQIDNPATLASVMQRIDDLEFTNKDMLGDLYEYVLSKLATQGTNGQFRTPTHIIDLMVKLIQPKPRRKSSILPPVPRAFSWVPTSGSRITTSPISAMSASATSSKKRASPATIPMPPWCVSRR